MKTLNQICFWVLCMVMVACSPTRTANKGHKAFENLAYSKAIEKYQKAIEKGAGDDLVRKRLGDSYRLTNEMAMAEKIYSQVVKKDHEPEYQLYYGQALMAMGKYDEALVHLNNFKDLRPDDDRADNLASSCERILEMSQNRGFYKIVPTNVNTEHADFGPSFYQDRVIFSSARNRNRFTFSWNKTNFLDLFEAKYRGSAKLGEVDGLGSNINSRFHEAITTYTPDGKTMYFTRNNYHRGKVGFSGEKVIKLKIYEAQLKGKKWKKTAEFPYNSKEYSVGHPSLTKLGDRMYFASDMPGGHGGVDIYYTDRKGNSWSKPVNLGAEINTEGDEMFPWMSPEGDLYFASNGLPGLGGLDLYIANGKSGDALGSPVNLGVPLNSSGDDFQLIVDEEKGMGFFTSNRAGGKGDDDIYAFRKNQVFEALVIDSLTRQPIEGVKAEIMDIRSNVTTAYSEGTGHFTSGIPRNQNFLITLTKDGYQIRKRKTTAKQVANEFPLVYEMVKTEECDPIDITLNGKVLEGQNLVPGATVKIQVKDFVVTTDENGELSVPLPPGFDFVVSLDEPGAENPKDIELTTKGIDETTEIPVELEFEKKGPEAPFFIIYYNYDKHNIRPYDARPELDRVYNYMARKPEIKVRLSSHTDSRASHAYNVTLSKNRATEAFEYLVSRGINKDRLKFEWHSEDDLVNGCRDGVKCTEEEHQLNRRTEFYLDK